MNASCNQTAHRGFTLLELLVSIGLFTVIMTLVAGAYLMMIAADRKAQALSAGIDNLGFALETMTRSMRTGTGFTCYEGNCESAQEFSFTDANGCTETYALNTNAHEITRALSSCTDTEPAVSITDPSVDVTGMTFTVVGASDTDDEQAYVTVVVSGVVAGGSPEETDFTVESSATMRSPDISS